ncbi:hypothetical protein B0H13DRAFT_1903677 [Mycena leptocephala]|nr:hypothetical protein B0H13DRAFT_1903677 [Mycena leptocephala]
MNAQLALILFLTIFWLYEHGGGRFESDNGLRKERYNHCNAQFNLTKEVPQNSVNSQETSASNKLQLLAVALTQQGCSIDGEGPRHKLRAVQCEENEAGPKRQPWGGPQTVVSVDELEDLQPRPAGHHRPEQSIVHVHRPVKTEPQARKVAERKERVNRLSCTFAVAADNCVEVTDAVNLDRKFDKGWELEIRSLRLRLYETKRTGHRDLLESREGRQMDEYIVGAVGGRCARVKHAHELLIWQTEDGIGRAWSDVNELMQSVWRLSPTNKSKISLLTKERARRLGSIFECLKGTESRTKRGPVPVREKYDRIHRSLAPRDMDAFLKMKVVSGKDRKYQTFRPPLVGVRYNSIKVMGSKSVIMEVRAWIRKRRACIASDNVAQTGPALAIWQIILVACHTVHLNSGYLPRRWIDDKIQDNIWNGSGIGRFELSMRPEYTDSWVVHCACQDRNPHFMFVTTTYYDYLMLKAKECRVVDYTPGWSGTGV